MNTNLTLLKNIFISWKCITLQEKINLELYSKSKFDLQSKIFTNFENIPTKTYSEDPEFFSRSKEFYSEDRESFPQTKEFKNPQTTPQEKIESKLHSESKLEDLHNTFEHAHESLINTPTQIYSEDVEIVKINTPKKTIQKKNMTKEEKSVSLFSERMKKNKINDDTKFQINKMKNDFSFSDITTKKKKQKVGDKIEITKEEILSNLGNLKKFKKEDFLKITKGEIIADENLKKEIDLFVHDLMVKYLARNLILIQGLRNDKLEEKMMPFLEIVDKSIEKQDPKHLCKLLFVHHGALQYLKDNKNYDENFTKFIEKDEICERKEAMLNWWLLAGKSMYEDVRGVLQKEHEKYCTEIEKLLTKNSNEKEKLTLIKFKALKQNSKHYKEQFIEEKYLCDIGSNRFACMAIAQNYKLVLQCCREEAKMKSII